MQGHSNSNINNIAGHPVYTHHDICHFVKLVPQTHEEE